MTDENENTGAHASAMALCSTAMAAFLLFMAGLLALLWIVTAVFGPGHLHAVCEAPC